MAYNSLRSKLNRAVAAHLVNVGGDCGTVKNISSANSVAALGYPNTKVQAVFSKPEVPLTGVRRVTVHITIKGKVSTKVGDPNEEAARVQFDKRVAAAYDAMMQSDDGHSLKATAALITAAGRALAVPVDESDEAEQFAANNADMAAFTCQEVYDAGEGEGEPDKEGSSWIEVLIFEIVASPSNCD